MRLPNDSLSKLVPNTEAHSFLTRSLCSMLHWASHLTIRQQSPYSKHTIFIMITFALKNSRFPIDKIICKYTWYTESLSLSSKSHNVIYQNNYFKFTRCVCFNMFEMFNKFIYALSHVSKVYVVNLLTWLSVNQLFFRWLFLLPHSCQRWWWCPPDERLL